MRARVFATSILCFMLLIPSAAAGAQGPTATATPTLKPIPPSPTSPYLWLHESPTPLPSYVPGPLATLDTDSQVMADTAINVYRRINANHIIDFILLAFTVAVAVAFLVKWIRQSTRDQ